MTHAELVDRAARWLRNSVRCGVVLTETPTGGLEIPDAVGFQGSGVSTLVECKVTRADFLAERKKVFRGDGGFMGVGDFRYYLTPPGLLGRADLPPRWGLIEAHLTTVRTRVKAQTWMADREGKLLRALRERAMLLSELRKYQIVEAGGTLLPSRAGRRVIESAERRRKAENLAWLLGGQDGAASA